uniref:Myb/SANT-like domain-containing protein n=1 Tax=Brassica oleracea var. oleracea TaxID=109376 RepID=A0A0D3DIT3_BRAOL
MVEKFNEEFGLDINYKFFKEKLDTLKKKYNKYRELLTSTGISVDPITSEIDASDSWWKDREACKIVHAFRRKPPHGWEIMERCFKLYNVQSQSQYSVNQRREEMMNQSATNNEDQLYQETFGGEMSDNEEPEMQENEEVYRVNINDDTRPSNELPICVIVLQRVIRFKFLVQEFNNKSEEDEEVLHKDHRYLHELYMEVVQEEVVNLLVVIILGGKTSAGQWGQHPHAQQWGTPPGAQQWGTPPGSQQWGTPPGAQQWGTPPGAQHWGTPPTAQQWGTPPNAPQWSTQQNSQQWGAYQNTQQWRSSSPVAPNWDSSSNHSQWGSSPNTSHWPSSTNVQHGFPLETQTRSTTNPQQGSSRREIPETRKTGGLFNIWGTQRGPNLNETHQSDDDYA